MKFLHKMISGQEALYPVHCARIRCHLTIHHTNIKNSQVLRIFFNLRKNIRISIFIDLHLCRDAFYRWTKYLSLSAQIIQSQKHLIVLVDMQTIYRSIKWWFECKMNHLNEFLFGKKKIVWFIVGANVLHNTGKHLSWLTKKKTINWNSYIFWHKTRVNQPHVAHYFQKISYEICFVSISMQRSPLVRVILLCKS